MSYMMDVEFKLRLKDDLPGDVRDVLRRANECWAAPTESDKYAEDHSNLPEHPFFAQHRWSTLLSATNTGVRTRPGLFDKDSMPIVLDRKCQYKNDDGALLEFLKWIAPYVDMTMGERVGKSSQEGFFGRTNNKIFWDGRNFRFEGESHDPELRTMYD